MKSQKFGVICAAMLVSASCYASAPTSVASAKSLPSTANTLSSKLASAKVDGFRSAKWGMTIDQTRAAIASDFKLDGAAVTQSADIGQGTKVLNASIPDLLQGGGKAQVSYVFGASSQKLMVVNVVWSPVIDSAITQDTLVQTASVLGRYFASSGYVGGTIKSGMAAKNGSVLIFSGADPEGHATLLLLNRDSQKDPAGKIKFKPSSLLLAYSANPAKPDVLRILPGQF